MPRSRPYGLPPGRHQRIEDAKLSEDDPHGFRIECADAPGLSQLRMRVNAAQGGCRAERAG